MFHRSNPTASDLTVQDEFSTYWGSFARTGSPSNGLQASLGEFTGWPIYTDEISSDVPVIAKGKRPLDIYGQLLPLMYRSTELETGGLYECKMSYDMVYQHQVYMSTSGISKLYLDLHLPDLHEVTERWKGSSLEVIASPNLTRHVHLKRRSYKLCRQLKHLAWC